MSTHPTVKKDSIDRPANYQTEIYQKGLLGEKPRFSFDYEAWGPAAKEILGADAWGYLHGNAGTGQTERNNKAAFNKWGIVPRRLVKFDKVNLETKILGQTLPTPLVIAPVGVLQIFNAGKENAVATAARNCNVPYTLSTAAASGIEEVAESSGDGIRFYQLYWPDRSNDDITASLLKRAKAAGYTALIVTLDTYILGWRPADENHAYNPFLNPDSVGVAIGFTDPVYRAKFKAEHGKEIEEDLGTAAAQWSHTIFPGHSNSWEDLEFIKQHWDGPIVLKGIQSVADAKRAVQAGVAGIVVSNHGGRQIDGCIASLDVLPEIAEAVGDKLDIIFDSGIRTGTDIAKALALGAKAVLVGRPYAYGLAMGGQAGVEHVLKCLLGDLDLSLQLAGIPSLSRDDLNRDSLRRTNE